MRRLKNDYTIRFRAERKRQNLTVGNTFFKLRTTAFGGPAAHIAMMEEEVIRRRQWMTKEGFLDLVGATNLIPGPNSTEMAIHIGYIRAAKRVNTTWPPKPVRQP